MGHADAIDAMNEACNHLIDDGHVEMGWFLRGVTDAFEDGKADGLASGDPLYGEYYRKGFQSAYDGA